MFNEVFLDDVFVPDDCVVGEVDGGWPLARTTLANERVAIGDSWGPGSRHTDMVRLIGELGGPGALRPAALEESGRLWASGQALSALGLRVTLSQLSGGESGDRLKRPQLRHAPLPGRLGVLLVARPRLALLEPDVPRPAPSPSAAAPPRSSSTSSPNALWARAATPTRSPAAAGRAAGRPHRRRVKAADADPVTHRESSRALLGCTRFGSPGILG